MILFIQAVMELRNHYQLQKDEEFKLAMSRKTEERSAKSLMLILIIFGLCSLASRQNTFEVNHPADSQVAHLRGVPLKPLKSD